METRCSVSRGKMYYSHEFYWRSVYKALTIFALSLVVVHPDSITSWFLLPNDADGSFPQKKAQKHTRTPSAAHFSGEAYSWTLRFPSRGRHRSKRWAESRLLIRIERLIVLILPRRQATRVHKLYAGTRCLKHGYAQL